VSSFFNQISSLFLFTPLSLGCYFPQSCFILFFGSLYFSILYLMFSIIPSSSSVVVQHYCVYASSYDLHLTASSEFSSIITVPLLFFLLSQRTRMSHSIVISIFLFSSLETFNLILCLSLVSSFTMCTPNIRFFTNPLHYTDITNLIATHNINISTLTETQIPPSTTYAQLFHAVPHGFTFINTPRLVPHPFTSSIVGGRYSISYP